MFTQMLGIITSLILTSQSKERPFALLHSQAIVSQLAALYQFSTSQAQSYHRAKKFLTEDVNFFPPESLSDSLSDVPEDILVIVTMKIL
jgi:hypothetical protein